MLLDPLPDPFGERATTFTPKTMGLLGGRIEFDSNSRELLALVDAAYRGLPRHVLPGGVGKMKITLRVSPARPESRPARPESRSKVPRGRLSRSVPPPLVMLQGAGLLGGATECSNFVVISPHEQSALVVISPDMLRFPYHTRYELIEFAVYTLAARAQGLVPLHAACVGRRGRGILLMGPSGAGKSTLALHCLLAGFHFLSEDSVFVAPESLLATGIANFLHVRSDSLRWLGETEEAGAIRRSPIIRRRSGVKKFEVDLRRKPFRLAPSPMQIAGIVFLSPRRGRAGQLLKPLVKSQLLGKMLSMQGYGANQPQWPLFSKNVSRLDAFELRRGRHPAEGIDALRSLLNEL